MVRSCGGMSRADPGLGDVAQALCDSIFVGDFEAPIADEAGPTAGPGSSLRLQVPFPDDHMHVNRRSVIMITTTTTIIKDCGRRSNFRRIERLPPSSNDQVPTVKQYLSHLTDSIRTCHGDPSEQLLAAMQVGDW
jgi:hypothetical protein